MSTLFGSPGAARSTDPETSHAAATDPAHVIRFGSQRWRLLNAFFDHRWFPSGLTDEEAGQKAGISRVADTRRCSELRQAGLIEPTGATRLTRTGSPARVHRITIAGVRTILGGQS